jgi:hypothetical protein
MELFPGNQLTLFFEETDQDLNRLAFQPDLSALLLELARMQIKLEESESDQTRGWRRWSHWNWKNQRYRV